MYTPFTSNLNVSVYGPSFLQVRELYNTFFRVQIILERECMYVLCVYVCEYIGMFLILYMYLHMTMGLCISLRNFYTCS